MTPTTDEPAVTCAVHGVPVEWYETGRGGMTVLCPRCQAALAPPRGVDVWLAWDAESCGDAIRAILTELVRSIGLDGVVDAATEAILRLDHPHTEEPE